MLTLSSELAGHVAVALRRHRTWAAGQSVRVPQGFAELERAVTSRATEGQSGTPLADLWEFSESRVMTPQLLSYEAAADVLSVSVRTLKRVLADPHSGLSPVRIGGGARIRTADLNAYVAHLGEVAA